MSRDIFHKSQNSQLGFQRHLIDAIVFTEHLVENRRLQKHGCREREAQKIKRTLTIADRHSAEMQH